MFGWMKYSLILSYCRNESKRNGDYLTCTRKNE